MTAPVNPPINTLVFTVSGRNEAELHRDARNKLDIFCDNPDDWVYGIDVEPLVVHNSGDIDAWQGQVTALKRM